MKPRSPYRSGTRMRIASGALFVGLMLVSPSIVIPLGVLAFAVRGALFATRRARRARSAWAQRGVRRQHQSSGELVAIGADIYTGRDVALPWQAFAAHGLILGASGAGKTTTLMTVLAPQIAQSRPVVVIDLKGSPGLARDLAWTAARSGREMRVWTLDGGSSWNPLAYGNATELKDKIIATERFSEPHYKRAAERYLQTAIQVLQETSDRHQLSLTRVVEMLDPQRLSALSGGLTPERAERVRDYLRSLIPDQVSAVRGLASRLAILTESHTGRFLEPPPASQAAELPQLDLRRALAGGEVVLFSLNSSTYGQLAGQIGTLAVQDLITASGARLMQDANAPQAVVAIDEFSALGSDNVMALLARGRESRVGVLLATQELADLDRAGRGLRDQVLGNTAVKIAHRQDVPESAAAVSRLAGTVKAWDHTYSQRSGGFGQGASKGSSARLIDKPVVEPEEVRSLRTGEAVMIVKSPRSETHVARVLPPAVDRGMER